MAKKSLSSLQREIKEISPNQIVWGYLVGRVTKRVRGALIEEHYETRNGKPVVVSIYEINTIEEEALTPWMLPGPGGEPQHLSLPYFLRDSVEPPPGYRVEWLPEQIRKPRKSKRELDVILNGHEEEEENEDLEEIEEF